MDLDDFSGSEGGGGRRKWGFEVPLGVRVTPQRNIPDRNDTEHVAASPYGNLLKLLTVHVH